MKDKSATFDEPNHLPAGYSHLVMHDLRMEPGQPPLTKIISGIPLLFLKLKSPAEFKSWELPPGARYGNEYQFGIDFLYHSGQNADKILFFGRIPAVLIALLLGWYVFLWAKQLYGMKAGYLALFLFVFSPNIIAHSQLVTPDIGLSCIMVIAMFYFRKFVTFPSYRTLLVSAVSIGIALLTKLSAVILLPVFLILSFLFWQKVQQAIEANGKLFFINKKIKAKSWQLFLLYTLSMGIIIFFIVWIGYGFEYGHLLTHKENHPTAVQFFSRFFPSDIVLWVVNLCEKISVPFPSFFAGFVSVRIPLRDTFLLGRYSYGSPWFGYLVAFLLKTPIPFIVLIAITVVFFLKKKTFHREDEWFLLAPVIGFLFMTAFARFGIHLKYILPIYPFLCIFVSQIINFDFMQTKTLRLVFWGMCLLYLLGSLYIYPHYLAYFNEFVGGPANGYKYLVDSNLDWGQDLKLLKKYQEKNNLPEIKLAYFGTADPDYYKINYQKLEPFQPTSGWIAISATYLQGIHTAREGYSWLKRFEPVAKIGYSIFLYNIWDKK